MPYTSNNTSTLVSHGLDHGSLTVGLSKINYKKLEHLMDGQTIEYTNSTM